MASISARPRLTATRHAIAVPPPPSTTTCHNARRRRLPVPARSRSPVPAPSRLPFRHEPVSRSGTEPAPVPPPQVVRPRPAHATSGPPPFGSAEHRNSAGAADGSPASAHGDRLPVGVDEIGGSGGSKTRAPVTAREPSPATAQPALPAGSVPERRGGVRAGTGDGSSPHGTQRTCSVGRPSADRHRGDHRVGPEHPLHPRERTRRRGRRPRDRRPRTRAGDRWRARPRRARAATAVMPPVRVAVSQPSSCQRTRVDERRGGERAVVTPAAR